MGAATGPVKKGKAMEKRMKCDLEEYRIGLHHAQGCEKCGCLYFQRDDERWRISPDPEEPTRAEDPPLCDSAKVSRFHFDQFAGVVKVTCDGQIAYCVDWPEGGLEPRVYSRRAYQT
jgi:hypothetical protein